MPRIFGLNLVGWIVTSVVFFLFGWLWFGILFDEKMMELMQYNETTVGAFGKSIGMVLGFVNVAIVSLGIGLLLKWLNVDKMGTAIKYGLIAAVCFSITTEAYGWIYGEFPLQMAQVDGAYNLIGYALVAAIWSFFD